MSPHNNAEADSTPWRPPPLASHPAALPKVWHAVRWTGAAWDCDAACPFVSADLAAAVAHVVGNQFMALRFSGPTYPTER